MNFTIIYSLSYPTVAKQLESVPSWSYVMNRAYPSTFSYFKGV